MFSRFLLNVPRIIYTGREYSPLAVHGIVFNMSYKKNTTFSDIIYVKSMTK